MATANTLFRSCCVMGGNSRDSRERDQPVGEDRGGQSDHAQAQSAGNRIFLFRACGQGADLYVRFRCRSSSVSDFEARSLARCATRPAAGLLLLPNRRKERVGGGIRVSPVWRPDRPPKERSPRGKMNDVGVTIREEGQQAFAHSAMGYEKQPSLGGITAGRA